MLLPWLINSGIVLAGGILFNTVAFVTHPLEPAAIFGVLVLGESLRFNRYMTSKEGKNTYDIHMYIRKYMFIFTSSDKSYPRSLIA